MNTGFLMFCGECDGMLVLDHLRHTAREVRGAVGRLFESDFPAGGWTAAKKEGWKVVRVTVKKREGH